MEKQLDEVKQATSKELELAKQSSDQNNESDMTKSNEKITELNKLIDQDQLKVKELNDKVSQQAAQEEKIKKDHEKALKIQ